MTEAKTYDEESEKAVLGCCISQPDEVLEETLAILDKADFYVPAHKVIYQCLSDMHRVKEPIATDRVKKWLEITGKAVEAGSPEILIEMMGAFSSHMLIGSYRRDVKDLSTKRHIRRACMEIIQDTEDASQDAASLIDRAESRILIVSHPHQGNEIMDAKSAVNDFRAFLADVEALTHSPMLKTGIEAIDRVNGGFPTPSYGMICAPPGGGKSAMMMTLNENWCSQGIGVGNLSLEMTARKLIQRRVGNRAGVDTRIMNSPLHPNVKHLVHAALDDIADTPFWIDPSTNLKAADLRGKVRKMVKAGAQVIIGDYVQLAEGSSNADNRKRQLAEISRVSANLAKEFSILFIWLAQITRDAQKRGNFQQHDIADASELTNDARFILMMEYEPEKNGVPYPLNRTPLIGRLNKFSDGSTGDVRLTIDKLTQKIW